MAIPLLGAFLAVSVGALLKRALVAVGVGTITYVGLDAAFAAAQAQIIANYGQLSGAGVQLADLAGVGAAIGIILGAMSGRIAIAVVSKFARIL